MKCGLLTLLIFMLNFQYGIAVSKEKPVIEIKHDPFAVFFPHLGDTLCRRKAFEIRIDKKTNEETKIKLWEKYKTTCSDDGSYQLNLAHMYLCDGYFSKAKDILEEYIKTNKNYDTKWHELFLHAAYQALEEKDKAVNLANEMISKYKHWYGGYTALGDSLIEIKDWSNAKKNLEASIKFYDKDPVTYTLLAAVSYELKEDDKVIDYYWKAFELNFFATLRDWRSSAAVVGVYVFRGKFDEAKNILDLQQDFFPEIKNSKKFQAVKDYYEKELKKANNSDTTSSS